MDNFPLAYALADSLAAYVLADVKDKQGQPLILHCRRVAAKCQSQNLSHEQIIAALLHDTIENDPCHGVDSDLLDILFGPEVRDLVEALTRDSWTEYMDYNVIGIMEIAPKAIPIKLADLEDNLDPSRGPIPDSLRNRYLKAKARLEKKALPR